MKKVCEIDGCSRAHRALGFCSVHYQYKWTRGEIEGTRIKPCTAVSCGRPATARGLCGKHYQRWKCQDTSVFPRCGVEGCDRSTLVRGLCRAHYGRKTKHGDPRIRKRRPNGAGKVPAVPRDLHWLAGLMEGEGCFGKRGKSASIQLSMTDEDVMRKAAGMFGSAVYGYRRGLEQHRKTVYHTRLDGPRAAGWMMTLYSLMGQRRRAAIRNALLAMQE